MSDTKYVILRKKTEVIDDLVPIDEWKVVTTVSASSARRALTAADAGAGEWVAVPARSWNPLTVKTEQVTKVTIG